MSAAVLPGRPMRILHTVQSYPPAEGGMAEVVRQLSERLVRMGHAVTVATQSHPKRCGGTMNGVRVVPFSVSGNSVNGIQGETAAYQQFLLGSRFDVVVNFAAQQWASDLAFPLLQRIKGGKVFVPTGFSGLYSRRYRRYFEQMPGWLKSYDMNVFLSDSYRDIAFARRHGITNTVLIPNGAAADEFLAPMPKPRERLGIPEGHLLVLHVGSHTGLKGHGDAMQIFSRADIADATLLIVGDEPEGGCGASCLETAHALNQSAEFQRGGKTILVRSLTRRDTVAAYLAADLFLFPSNIECSPIVLFECMASRTPFLAADVGNSAEIMGWSGGAGELLPQAKLDFWPCEGTLKDRVWQKLRILLGRVDFFTAVRADIAGSAALLEALCRDPARRERMAEAGFRAWEEKFTWEGVAGQYQELYRKVAEGAACLPDREVCLEGSGGGCPEKGAGPNP